MLHKKTFLVLTLLLCLCSLSGQGKKTQKEQMPPPAQDQEKICRPGHPAPLPFSDLTAEQIEQFKKTDLELRKTVMPINNKIGELEAKLKTEATAEAPLMKELDRLIDEISSCKALIRKAEMKMQQEIRKLLTPEQRLQFDSMPALPPSGMPGQPHMGLKHQAPCPERPADDLAPRPMPR